MGNWRRVQVVGTCDASEVEALRAALDVGYTDDKWTPLCSGGLAGLPNFAAEHFSAVGNLGERGYDVDDVRDALVRLAESAPSLDCVVHCGSDYEKSPCIATVTLAHGKVTVIDPQIEHIPEVLVSDMMARLGAQMNPFQKKREE